MSDFSPEFEQALQRFDAGDKLGAENLLRQVAGDAKFLHGSQSREFARASYELASILIGMGRQQDAVEAMREAASVMIPDDYQVTKNRMTYLTDLGALLGDMGEIAEANKLLRQSLTLRGDFYGKDHSGYAFGLEPLAVLTMKAGHLAEALKMIDRTITIFWKDGHPRVASAFPWRAMILKLMGNKTPAFAGLEDLPEEIMGELVTEVESVLDSEQAVASQAVVFDLLQAVQTRFGADHQYSIDVQMLLAGVQRWIGPSEGRIESLERLARGLLKQRKVPEALKAMLGLAEAFDELKDEQSAKKVYKQAHKIAKQAGDMDGQSTVLRNFALYCSNLGQKEEAEKLLRMAVASAKQAQDPELFSRTLIALGIFLQHKGQLEEAERLLKVGLRPLPPADRDFICGNSHLQAILTGDPCPCGDPAAAASDALRQHLLQSLPNDLVSDVHVEVTPEGFEIHLDYQKDLSEAEKETLRRAMTQAQIEFDNKMKRGR